MTRAVLALSIGDPAGVGPEITVKAWRALCTDGPAFVAIGDFDVLAAMTSSSDAMQKVETPDQGAAIFRQALPVIHRPVLAPVELGKPTADNAIAVTSWIAEAVRLAANGQASGVVTAPIAKAPLYKAGFNFPGHTEYLADLTAGMEYAGPRGPIMMLQAGGLRTVLATVHTPLRQAPGQLSVERIIHVGEVTDYALRHDHGIARPRFALAALNPHAGENGGLGREEIEIIAPAARALRERGIDCTDPLPADSLFHAEARAGYDCAICMYHDQALIPIKMLDFWGGVNVTLGLPIIRTSPDHGTAFAIAGRGLAREDSLVAAIRLGADIAARRNGP